MAESFRQQSSFAFVHRGSCRWIPLREGFQQAKAKHSLIGQNQADEITHVVHLSDGSHPAYPPPILVYESLPHRVLLLLAGPGQTFVKSDDDDVEIHYRVGFIWYQ